MGSWQRTTYNQHGYQSTTAKVYNCICKLLNQMQELKTHSRSNAMSFGNLLAIGTAGARCNRPQESQSSQSEIGCRKISQPGATGPVQRRSVIRGPDAYNNES